MYGVGAACHNRRVRAHGLCRLSFLPLLLGAAFVVGCKGSAKLEAKTGDDVSAEANTSWEGAEGQEGAKTQKGGGGKGTVDAGPASGPPTVTMPGFDVQADGRSVVTVTVRGPVTVTEQKAEGRLVYLLGGVTVPEKVNRLPLLTQHFPTQVTAVTLEQAAGGAQLVIDLREPSKATHKVSSLEAGGSLVTITLPRSEKYGKTALGTDDPSSFERPEGETGGDESAEIDESGTDVPEDADEETERRRRKSKRQPKPYVMRSITQPRATLAPDIGLSFAGQGKGTPLTYLTSGIRIGIIDEFEIEATPHSFRLSPRSSYALPSLGITAGYTGHVFEVAGRARYFIGVDTNGSDYGAGGLVLGVPMAIHLSTWGRIDTGGFVTMDFDGMLANARVMRGPRAFSDFKVGLYELQASPFYTDNGIPLKFIFNPTEDFWLGVHHGIAIYDFDAAGDTFALPLGAEIGVTTSDEYNPVADLGFRVDWPEFIYPGDSNDALHEDTYEVGIWFRWYHHL